MLKSLKTTILNSYSQRKWGDLHVTKTWTQNAECMVLCNTMAPTNMYCLLTYAKHCAEHCPYIISDNLRKNPVSCYYFSAILQIRRLRLTAGQGLPIEAMFYRLLCSPKWCFLGTESKTKGFYTLSWSLNSLTLVKHAWPGKEENLSKLKHGVLPVHINSVS